MPAPAANHPDDEVPREAIGPARLFVAFSKLALSGFGGVLPFAYRALVEQRKWLTAKEFAGILAVAQVMPGPTICNLSVMIGQRFAGAAGAAAALAGMVAGPSLVVLVLGFLWQRYGAIDVVRLALAGMSAVAIGLILSTAIRMGIAQFGPGEAVGRLRRVAQVALCVIAFVGIGILRWPLAAVVAGLAPFAIALAWFADP